MQAVAAIAVAMLVLVGFGAFVAWRTRRDLVRRLTELDATATDAAARMADAQAAFDRLADAYRLIGHGIIVSDELGEIVFRNDRADELVGDRLGEALATPAIHRLLAGAVAGEAGTEQVELFGPPHRTLTVSAAPLVEDARLIGAAVVIEDISERRRLEAIRRDFVANISHELKTPVGALGLLAETLAGEDDPVVAGRLTERMQVEAFRVGRIIEDLLDLTRIEAEESPARDAVAVHVVLAEAAERLRGVADHRGVDLDVREPSRRMTVLGDRRQLVSAVHGLVENAIAYSDAGSSVVVEARLAGAWVEIVVSDTGIGIPVRDLERIFERFYRVDRARARETGGTGLGLAIVRHVAGNHGGDVRVESQEGRGSTFTLRLPAGPGPVALPQPTAEAG